MKNILLVLLMIALPLVAQVAGVPVKEVKSEFATIFCGEEHFPGHLQGIAADETGIYWSFYNTILKTDWTGKTIRKIASPTHAGDCCLVAGKLYVSVCYYNKKQAEAEGGTGWCYIYDSNLDFVKKEQFTDTPRPDGITFLDGKLYVSNDDFGHDPHPFNFVQIYDADFKFLKNLKVDIGMPTQYGAQTLNVVDGMILASFYGDKGQSWFLEANTLKRTDKRFPFSPQVGLADVPEKICGQKGVVVMADNMIEKINNVRWFSAKLMIRKFENGKLKPVELNAE